MAKFHLVESVDKVGIQSAVDQVLASVGIDAVIPLGARVAIKPNLTYPKYKLGVTTTPALVEAVCKALLRRTSKVRVVESDGALAAWTADEAFSGHGLDVLCGRLGVETVNLSRCPTVKVRLPVESRRIEMELPRLLVDETDILISLPVIKTHALTGVTLGLKNLWGCIPSPKRLLFHPVINDALVGLARQLHLSLVVYDGLVALDGLGPMYGDPVPLHVIAATDDPGAGEAAVCRLMGIDMNGIPHLCAAAAAGLVPPLSKITANVDLNQRVLHQFRPRQDLRQRLVAATVFRSRLASQVVYLSPLSKVKDLVLRVLQPDRLK